MAIITILLSAMFGGTHAQWDPSTDSAIVNSQAMNSLSGGADSAAALQYANTAQVDGPAYDNRWSANVASPWAFSPLRAGSDADDGEAGTFGLDVMADGTPNTSAENIIDALKTTNGNLKISLAVVSTLLACSILHVMHRSIAARAANQAAQKTVINV